MENGNESGQLYADFTVAETEGSFYYEELFSELIVKYEISQEELNYDEKAA
jgi:hypothetical protein